MRGAAQQSRRGREQGRWGISESLPEVSAEALGVSCRNSPSFLSEERKHTVLFSDRGIVVRDLPSQGFYPRVFRTPQTPTGREASGSSNWEPLCA